MTGSTGITVAAEVGAAAAPAPVVREGVVVVSDGEVVVLRLRPHPLFIVLSMLGPVVACLASAGALWWMSGRKVEVVGGAILELPRLGGVWAVPFLAGVGLVMWQGLEWWCRGYLLTDRRVVRVSGVLRQSVVEIPLARVQQVMMYKSLRERVCGLGTPGVSSAGSGEVSHVFWNMVSRPEERMRVMRETIDRYAGNGHGHGSGVGSGGGAA